MAKIRTFIAVEIPEDIRDKIAEFQNELKSSGGKVTWVKPENMHLTLKFLGDTDEAIVDDIEERIKSAAQDYEPFSVHVKGVGAFPNFKKARVLWIAVDEGMQTLQDLAGDVDKQISELGFEREKRKYTAHLTIGRVKDSRSIELVRDKMVENQNFSAGEFKVDSIYLIKSQLTQHGPIYTKLKKITLT